MADDPLTTSIINTIEPVLDPVLVAVFYEEKLGTLALIGAAIVLFGILYYNIREALAAELKLCAEYCTDTAPFPFHKRKHS